MKRFLLAVTALTLALLAEAQTMNVKVGNVIYQFPAAQTGDMTYTDGTTLTIMGRTFTLSDITSLYVDETEVSNNLVTIS